MPQHGVTLVEVEATVQALRAAARPVTTRSVRHALGDRGSLTTLSTHLRTVRQREAEQEDEARSRLALPDAVVEGLVRGAERYWAEINDAAEAIVAQAQAQAQERVDAARGAAREAREAEEGSRAAQAKTAETLAETERAFEALRAAHDALEEEHRGLEVTLGLAEERARGAEELAAERKEAIAQRDALLSRTQGELMETREALEGHRAEAAARESEHSKRVAEVESERRTAEAAGEQLRVRLGAMESALDRVTTEREEAIASCEESRKLRDTERRAQAQTERELATFRERCDGLARTLERSEGYGHTLTAALERAEERAAQAQAALEAMSQGPVHVESTASDSRAVD